MTSRSLLACLVSAFVLAPSFAYAQDTGAPAPAEKMKEKALPDAATFTKLSLAQRRAVLKTVGKAAIEALYKSTSLESLLETAERNALALGTYSSTVYKTERVDGDLIETQTIETVVQEQPHAVRMNYVDGPGKGRRVVFNSANADHKHDIRVKEAGLAGLVGALWIDIDSGLTRKESNYAVTAMGLGPMLKIVVKQIRDAKQENYVRRDEGLGSFNRYFVHFEPKKKGLLDVRLGFDVETGVATFVEVKDDAGLRERHDWRDVKRRKLAKDYFTPEAAGL